MKLLLIFLNFSYDSDTFACGLSFPASILIREHSVELYMTEKEQDYKSGKLFIINR